MTITTNNQPRDLLSFGDFSPAEQRTIRDEFDWMKDLYSTTGFFKYKGHIYHLEDFTRGGAEGWDGNKAESYFCGVLIKVSSDCDKVICGWWSA